MVAAWMRAETGVGPSMASGSQVCRGTWADLANAPTSSSRPATTIGVELCANVCGTAWNTPRNCTVPVCLNRMNVAMTSPTSPTTLITNALMPARVAVVRRYQNEISRYEAAPTNAQPTISIMKLPASTSSSIESTKKFRYAKYRLKP